MHSKHRSRSDRSGVILLVVLGALTFFSVLVATYLVFANEARESSFALSQRQTRRPDVNWMMNEALMTLIRGTSDTNNPMYGEGLLDDFYGHDGASMRVKFVNNFNLGPQYFGRGFVRFPLASANGTARQAGVPAVNDAYSGSLITFTEGPLENQTYRVIRSIYRAGAGIGPYDDLYIEIDQSVFGNANPAATAVLSLFYQDPADLTLNSYRLHLNGAPRNSRGIGYTAGGTPARNVNEDVAGVANFRQPGDPYDQTSTRVGFTDLPVSLQPNHLGPHIDKSTMSGDFDESYDAPDHNNWFLSHRRADGTVIPSFHRPAVFNYILNHEDWSSAGLAETRNLLASLQRATFRPLPIAAGQMSNPRAINEGFTGSNSYVLRTPIRLWNSSASPPAINTFFLDQLAQALIQNGEYDVDNDADGQTDSIWMPIGLPMFTSREGKLLQPLIAPMIEDLSGRLNLNAHTSRQLNSQQPGLISAQAFWAGTLAPFGTSRDPNNPAAPNNDRFVFRGLGWGPAEIALPLTDGNSVIFDANILNDLNAWLNQRYRFGEQTLANIDVPGRNLRDVGDILRFGYRAPFHRTVDGYGYSSDPFGRGGVGMGRSGHILAAESGTAISAPSVAQPNNPFINEAINNPYESDPRGRLSGDRAALLADLEVILRTNDFDSDLLPDSLRDRFNRLITQHPTFGQSFTTVSVSDDRPSTIRAGAQTPYLALVNLIQQASGGINFTQEQLDRLIAPEIRLGRKLDLNRRIGNGVDDNNNDVVDEPLEVNRVDYDTNDNNSDGQTDEAGETNGERNAFASYGAAVGTIPGTFQNQSPNYTFDEPVPAAGDIPVNGRQLLARHLYVLAMAVTRDLETPTNEVDFPSVSAAPGTNFDPARYKARRLAQWAVNVVDYCDPDSINTRFVYDATPFDGDDPMTAIDDTGWSPPVDTLAMPAEMSDPSLVVWGVESPQMVFSESAAYHDVRVRDTDRDASNKTKTDTMNPDPHTDQVRIPQGSLFLELFCPFPVINGDFSSKPGAPQESFNTAANGFSQLNLAASAPLPNGGVGAPVWRIAISEAHYAALGAPQVDLNPARQRTDSPDSASFQPEYPDELEQSSPGSSLSYDRFILFRDFAETDTDPDAAFTRIDDLITNINASVPTPVDMSADQIFYAPRFNGDAVTNVDRQLESGQFLVLAPRAETRFGSKAYPAGTQPSSGVAPGIPSDQRLSIFPNEGLVQAAHDDTRLTPALTGTTADPFTRALPMVIAAPRPPGWMVPSAAHPNTERSVIGMSVSEPLPRGGSYYPQPDERYNGTQDLDSNGDEDYELTDGYINFDDPATMAIDEPLDVAIGRIPNNGNDPLLGTIDGYCSAFLQRLADPTLPYHPTLNPYRTVDWINVDLNVFSGDDPWSALQPDPDAATLADSPTYRRRTRQRNGFARPPGSGPTGTGVAANALFSYETDFSSPNQALTWDPMTPGATDEFFEFDGGGNPNEAHINSSFSFLNTPWARINEGFVGFSLNIGSLGATANNVVGNDRNLPQIPYAIHPWLNRPFASHFELLMVPASSQGRLFEEFTFNPNASPPVFPDETRPQGDLNPAVLNSPFGHLLNFFYSSDRDADAPELARVFDYVHTLPRYRGEVELVDPQRLLPVPPIPPVPAPDPTTAAQGPLGIFELRRLMSPPFNLKYDNQRQARVNLNTLSQFPVWAGLMHGHLNAAEYRLRNGQAGSADQLSFNNFIQNRRGYTVGGAPSRVTGAQPYNYDPGHLDPDFPTEFAGVFQSATDTGKAIEVDGATGANTDVIRRRPVNGTLLRTFGALELADPNGGTPTPTSMMVRAPMQIPLATPATAAPLHGRLRNPFMRYQSLMRMPNLVSDNSQTFVIRLTLGFFEVDADTLDLRGEYNADIGQNQRFQATFVVDRSIPVGFVPGEDLNARDTVIFESYGQ